MSLFSLLFFFEISVKGLYMAARVYISMELLTPLAYFGNSMEFLICLYN